MKSGNDGKGQSADPANVGLKTRMDTDEDKFRSAMADVQPLKPHNRVVHQTPKPGPVPQQRLRDEIAVLDELLHPVDGPVDLETGEELLFLRPGYPQRLLRKLRRGHFSVDDSIDLHSMAETLARDVLLEFLNEAGRRGWGCIRVVHGKGLRSRGMPKLKLMTNSVLRKHPPVIAFASCRPVDGGTGAVNVLLKKGHKFTR